MGTAAEPLLPSLPGRGDPSPSRPAVPSASNRHPLRGPTAPETPSAAAPPARCPPPPRSSRPSPRAPALTTWRRPAEGTATGQRGGSGANPSGGGGSRTPGASAAPSGKERSRAAQLPATCHRLAPPRARPRRRSLVLPPEAPPSPDPPSLRPRPLRPRRGRGVPVRSNALHPGNSPALGAWLPAAEVTYAAGVVFGVGCWGRKGPGGAGGGGGRVGCCQPGVVNPPPWCESRARVAAGAGLPAGSAGSVPTAADGLRAAACPSPGLGGPNSPRLLRESFRLFSAGPPAPRLAPSGRWPCCRFSTVTPSCEWPRLPLLCISSSECAPQLKLRGFLQFGLQYAGEKL